MFTSIQEKARRNIENAQQKQAEYYNKHTKPISFNEGDKVLLKIEPYRTKFGPRYEGPFTILHKRGLVNYKITREGYKKTFNVHVNKLKPFY